MMLGNVQKARRTHDLIVLHPNMVRFHPAARPIVTSNATSVAESIWEHGYKYEEPVFSVDSGIEMDDEEYTIVGGSHRSLAGILNYVQITSKTVNRDVIGDFASDIQNPAVIRLVQLTEPTSAEWGIIAQGDMLLKFILQNPILATEKIPTEFLPDDVDENKKNRNFLYDRKMLSVPSLKRIKRGLLFLHDHEFMEHIKVLEAEGKIKWKLNHFTNAGIVADNGVQEMRSILQQFVDDGTLKGSVDPFRVFLKRKEGSTSKKRKTTVDPAVDADARKGREYEWLSRGPGPFSISEVYTAVRMVTNCIGKVNRRDVPSKEMRKQLKDRIRDLEDVVEEQINDIAEDSDGDYEDQS